MNMRSGLFLLLVLLLSSFCFGAPASFTGYKAELNPGTISINNEPVLIANFSIAELSTTTNIVLGSGSAERLTGIGTQTLELFFDIDSVESYRTDLRSFSGNDIWGAFSIDLDEFELSAGNNQIEMWIEDSVGTYSFSYLDMFSIENKTSDNETYNYMIQQVNEIIPDTSDVFIPLKTYNYTVTSAGKISILADLKTDTTRNPGDIQRYYILHENSSSISEVFESEIPRSGITRSTGTNHIFNVTPGYNEFTLYGSAARGDGTVSGTILFEELSTPVGNVIQSEEVNCGGTWDSPITLDPGLNLLCELNYTIESGNSVRLFFDADLYHVAVAEMEIIINVSNGESVSIYRDTQEIAEYMHIPYRNTANINGTNNTLIQIYANAPLGTTSRISEASLSVFDSTLLEIDAEILPPIPGSVLFPVNDSLIYNDTLADNIVVSPYSDSQSSVSYTVNLTSVAGSNIGHSVIAAIDYPIFLVPFNYSLLLENNTYEINVEGCNIYDLCSYSISQFNFAEAPNRVRYVGRDLDTEYGAWDSSTEETLLANGTFEAEDKSSGIIFGSGSIKKICPNNITNSVSGMLNINGVDNDLGTLRSFSQCDAWGSYSFTSILLENLIPVNTYGLNYEDEGGVFSFNENEFLMIANYSSEKRTILQNVESVSYLMEPTYDLSNYNNIQNFSINVTSNAISMVADIKGKSSINTEGSFYIRNFDTGDNSKTFYVQPSGNNATYSTGTNWIFEFLDPGINNFGLFAASTADYLNISGSVTFNNLNDDYNSAINYGYDFAGCDIAPSGESLEMGWNKVCEVNILNTLNYSNVLYFDTDTFSNIESTMVVRINSTGTSEYKDYYRTFTNESKYGHVPIRMFSPSSPGVVVYEAWIWVEEPILIYPTAISVLNIENEEGTVDYYPPLPGLITIPEDGSFLAQDSGVNTIDWTEFLGIRPSLYNVNIYLGNGGLIRNIITGTNLTSISYNYGELLYGEDYRIVVEGCNPSGQCRSAESEFTYERSADVTKNNCQGIIGDVYETFDLLTVAIILLAAMLVIGVVMAMIGGKSGGMDFNATLIIMIITAALIAVAVWTINYLGTAYC